MEINHHIFFGAEKAPELLQYLQGHDIPYEDWPSIIFDISQSDPHWPAVREMVEAKSLSYLSETVFSKEELRQAQWLRVRSTWHNGYPQPESAFGYQRITYTETDYCKGCGCGLRQIAPFRFKTPPKWGNRHFMSLNWVPDELFVDDTARNVLTEAGLAGFHFREIYDKKGQAVFPDAQQMCVEETSRPGFVEGRRDLREVQVCPVCGVKRFHPNGIGMHAFYARALESMPDICKTAEYFGWGKGANHLILIRQSFYRALVDNKLDRSLVFAPIELL